METKQAPSLGQTVLAEIQKIGDGVVILRDFADLLGKRGDDGENFLDVTIRLLSLLVAGTEETHRRLEVLHAKMLEPGFVRAMRLAILED